MKKICYRTVFALFNVVLRSISKYKPPRTYIRRGDLTEGVTSLGAYIWKGLYMERLIFGILRYVNYGNAVRSIASKIVTITLRRGNDV